MFPDNLDVFVEYSWNLGISGFEIAKARVVNLSFLLH